MTNTIDPLKIRKVLGKKDWNAPIEQGEQWVFTSKVQGSIIVSVADYPEPDSLWNDWIHASISRRDYMPTYEDLKLLHEAVFGDRWAYQIFAPPSRHLNIHNFALHLFGRLDGTAIHPDFQKISGINSI